MQSHNYNNAMPAAAQQQQQHQHQHQHNGDMLVATAAPDDMQTSSSVVAAPQYSIATSASCPNLSGNPIDFPNANAAGAAAGDNVMVTSASSGNLQAMVPAGIASSATSSIPSSDSAAMMASSMLPSSATSGMVAGYPAASTTSMTSSTMAMTAEQQQQQQQAIILNHNASAQQHSSASQFPNPGNNGMQSSVSFNPAVTQNNVDQTMSHFSAAAPPPPSTNGQQQLQQAVQQQSNTPLHSQSQLQHRLQHQLIQDNSNSASTTSSAQNSPVPSATPVETPTILKSNTGPFTFAIPSSNHCQTQTQSQPQLQQQQQDQTHQQQQQQHQRQASGHINGLVKVAPSGVAVSNFSAPVSHTNTSGISDVGLSQSQQQQQPQQQQQISARLINAPAPLLTSAEGGEATGGGGGTVSVVSSSQQFSPIDSKPSSGGLTISQMEPNFASSLGTVPAFLYTNSQMASMQGHELASKACADLAENHNKIVSIIVNHTNIDPNRRMQMRQDFLNAVSTLDRAFFLSPAGPGYIGMSNDESNSTRKRAYTVNSADGNDDSNKHRRTISVASDPRSDVGSIILSPHMRPPLGQHTHSSPLLPVENHYRATSSGLSDTLPAPKASDLAASGSHLVGRPVVPTPLYQSVLASDETTVPNAMGAVMAPVPMQPQMMQGNGVIISPTPVQAINPQLSLGGLHAGNHHLSNGGPVMYAPSINPAAIQTSYQTEGVDPSHMQIQSSTTPTPQQQQAYITPPMDGMPRFDGQGRSSYADTDMTMADGTTVSNTALSQSAAPTPTSVATVSHSGGSTTRSRPATRAGHPGSLDFTTLRPKDEDSNLTSPYASSHLSMSSFPFSNSMTSQTSGSRSRATSFSRNTSASRSRAPSVNSLSFNASHGPDAQELQTMLGSLNTLPSPINEDDDDEEHFNHADSAESRSKKDNIAPELMNKYNHIFLQWLPRVCSDVDVTDRKGEKIHQPLMAKKMAKLDEERAFRPFKFRIQPFTNSFQDACRDLGLNEAETAPKLIKQFLWNQPLISRFNDEGKKTKSRGNHVWSIEARIIAPGHYEFRPPPPKIVPLPATAAPKIYWHWCPKVLDSSCQGPPMSASFSCPNLPDWLEFRDDILEGTPPIDATSIMLDIVAEYAGHKLVQTFTVAVVAEDGVRPVSNYRTLPSPTQDEQMASAHTSHSHTPTTTGGGDHVGDFSGSSLSSGLTRSTNSLMTPPSVATLQQGNNGLLPSPLPALSRDKAATLSNGAGLTSKMMPAGPAFAIPNLSGSPNSPQQPIYNGMTGQIRQPVPMYLPTQPTDATTLASASHIKQKLVEATTIHHENMAALNPVLPPPVQSHVTQAVDHAIRDELAALGAHPTMPTAVEVFNATLQVSARSQQWQSEQLSEAVTAVTQSITHPPQLSSQVASQLANFSFTPSNTPGTRSPETSFIGY